MSKEHYDAAWPERVWSLSEEFAIILPQTDAEGAWQMAQAIQKAVQSLDQEMISANKRS